MQGPAGATGEPGAPANKQFRRVETGFVTIPANSTSDVTMATTTFTPTTTGTALVRGRGYCNLTGGASLVQLNFTTQGSFTNWSNGTAINVPAGSIATNYQLNFTTENPVAVTAGTEITITLLARREVSSANAANCSGSMFIEIYTGTF